MFSDVLFHDLERLLFLCENGMALTCKIKTIKEEAPENWTAETTKRMQDLSNRIQETLACILEFDTEQFTRYLNVSNFHQDFINESHQHYGARPSLVNSLMSKYSKFSKKIFSSPPKTESSNVLVAPQAYESREG